MTMGRLDWATAWDSVDREVVWEIEGIVEQGQLMALYSPPKTGKSLLMLEWSAALATGGEIMGKPVKPTRVVYVDMENTVGDIVNRLRAMGYTAESVGPLNLLSFPSMMPLDSPEGGAWIRQMISEFRPEFVVFDTVGRMIRGKENEADTWRAAYRLSFMELKRQGITTVRLDHQGKDADKGQRGSSEKNADVDVVMSIEAVGQAGRICLKRTHSRTGNGPEQVHLVRSDGGPLRHDPLGARQVLKDGVIPGCTVEELILAMDQLRLPREIGRPSARDHLAAAGYSFRSDTLMEAVRQRKLLATPPAPIDISRGRRIAAPAAAPELPPSVGQLKQLDPSLESEQLPHTPPLYIEGVGGSCEEPAENGHDPDWGAVVTPGELDADDAPVLASCPAGTIQLHRARSHPECSRCGGCLQGQMLGQHDRACKRAPSHLRLVP